MPPTYTQLASDTFNRGNENPLNPSNWTVWTGYKPLKIQSAVCQPVGVAGESAEIYTGISWPNDQYAQVQVNQANNNGTASVIVRGNNTPLSGYRFTIDGNGSMMLQKTDSVLMVGTYKPGANHIIRMEAAGPIIVGYLDGTAALFSFDTSFTGGSAGVSADAFSGQSDVSLSNFVGGQIIGDELPSISDPLSIVVGFTPNYYFAQQNAGLAVWISTGTINGVTYQGQLVTLPKNSTTQINISSTGSIVFGPTQDHLYPVAVVVTGPVVTSGNTVNNSPFGGKGQLSNVEFSDGILSITDIRPTGTFGF